MNEQKISPEELKLTAYALGELEGAERVDVERALQSDPVAQATVADIRALAGQLEEALAKEPMDEVQPVGTVIAFEQSRETSVPVAKSQVAGKRMRFPLVIIGSLAAACFAVVVVVRENRRANVVAATVDGQARSEEQAVANSAAQGASEADAFARANPARSKGKYPPIVLVRDATEFAALPVPTETFTDVVAEKIADGKWVSPATLQEAASVKEGAFARVQSAPVSTFSAQVNTTSYSNVRRLIALGLRPPVEAVRIEEMVNFFSYRYPPTSERAGEPLSASMEVASAPWNPAHRLVRIGVRGRETAEMGGMPEPIAKNVKLEVEFNPAMAQAYRLIGYENRTPDEEAAKNEKMDAAEIGAGQTVTALYEVVPVGAASAATATATATDVEPLKSQSGETEGALAQSTSTTASEADAVASKELFTLKIRFEEPKVDVSQKLEIPLVDTGGAFEAASKDFKFAAAVASLGMILRESQNKGKADYDQVITWAEAGRGDDADGRRGEFIELVKKARALMAE